MKIGDLVKRIGPMAIESNQNIGIVVLTEGLTLLVHWGDNYGTFWTPSHCLEVLNAS
jgi:hypothetical protein